MNEGRHLYDGFSSHFLKHKLFVYFCLWSVKKLQKVEEKCYNEFKLWYKKFVKKTCTLQQQSKRIIRLKAKSNALGLNYVYNKITLVQKVC